MNKYLFFDTETSGLPKDYKAPASDVDSWPRLVQIGWILVDDHQNVLSEVEYIVRPEGFTISKDVSDIHRVTQERAEQDGVAIGLVLNEFARALSQVDHVVGHNVDFDINIVAAEFFRDGDDDTASKLIYADRICTMKGSTDYCKLPSLWGYKWPKLMELHVKLFDEEFEEAHDAIADIRATAKCFFELQSKGIIS